MRYQLIIGFFLCVFSTLYSELRVPPIFSSGMVLQRNQVNPVWGWSNKNTEISISFAGDDYSTVSNNEGYWKIELFPKQANATEQDMLIKSGDSIITLNDILFGEVWLCSGQSNMQWSLLYSFDSDLELPSANYPQIRILSIPHFGSQEPQNDFEGHWQAVTPKAAKQFSAVGYYFGKILHQNLNVPIGLIDNSWGGSTCEAWIPVDVLSSIESGRSYIQYFEKVLNDFDEEKAVSEYEDKINAWRIRFNEAREKGLPEPRKPWKKANPFTGQHRPGNLYNGVLHPIIGYGIKGVIWYQGEGNVKRAFGYRNIFPKMIETWRKDWGQGDFPFYWVQIADYLNESPVPSEVSLFAEIRESQTLTLNKLPNLGQAVIIDLGEGRDIHPRNKKDVASRLARIALARDYGFKIPYKNPSYASMEIGEGFIVLDFNDIGEQLYSFDSNELKGFTLCGEDGVFANAQAGIINGSKIKVWVEGINDPVAVRYAWASNPICNIYSQTGSTLLPLTPFRTDRFPLKSEKLD